MTEKKLLIQKNYSFLKITKIYSYNKDKIQKKVKIYNKIKIIFNRSL